MKSNENWLMDNTGDIKIKKNIILTEPDKTIAQRLQNKISLNYKEWFLHESEGVNWFGTENLEGNIGKKRIRYSLYQNSYAFCIVSLKVTRAVVRYKTGLIDHIHDHLPRFRIDIRMIVQCP